jgi:hypothetical protein
MRLKTERRMKGSRFLVLEIKKGLNVGSKDAQKAF